MAASSEAQWQAGPPGLDGGPPGLDLLEDAWVRAGGVALTPWWWEWARGWGRSRREVLRVGRRGGKSTMLSRLAVCELLWGSAAVPAGDVGVVAIVSVDRREASERVRTIGAMLDAVGVGDRRRQVGELAHGVTERRSYADAIHLTGPWGERQVRVYTATIAGVSGFTAIAALCDEVAKWRDRDTGTNPAVEVLRSLGPTMATQPGAVMLLSSSPWAESDAHAHAFEEASPQERLDFHDGAWISIGARGLRAAYAPTWVANPTLTEAMAMAMEPDPITWAREYKAIPMADAASAWFEGGLVDACVA